MSLTGLKDVDRELLKYVSDRDLLEVCSLDRRTWNEVCDDNFLKRRLARYPGIEKYKEENESWKRFFLRVIYYTSRMKEKFKFDYVYGDFKKQYNLLKKSKYTGINELLSRTLLDYEKTDLPLVRYAVENGADIHDNDDWPLWRAAENGNTELVRYLIDNGANVHARYDEALRRAVAFGNLETVKYLIEHGADISVLDEEELDFAEDLGKDDIVEYIKSLKEIESE